MSGRDHIEVAFRGTLGRFRLDAAFTVPARGITALYGPSGCGKTTVLRCIAGLQRLADGTCIVAGDVWQRGATVRPAHDRPVGFVFQEASLFAHLTVRRNLLFGARRRARGPSVGAVGFDDAVALLGLAPLLDRAPQALSGGERQRVALGRALLSRPALMLMDEPMSALDRGAKDEIIPFLERLNDSLAIPTLYVTHDMAEVERLAQSLVLMAAGRVIGAGPVATLQRDPALPLFAHREAAVSLDCVVEHHDAADGLTRLQVDGGVFLAPTEPLVPGQRRRLRVAAGDVSLTRERPSQTTILNVMPVQILSATATGAHELTAVLGLGEAGEGARLLCRATRHSWAQLALAEGDSLYAQVKGIALAARD